jgi:hypothetical protein
VSRRGIGWGEPIFKDIWFWNKRDEIILKGGAELGNPLPKMCGQARPLLAWGEQSSEQMCMGVAPPDGQSLLAANVAKSNSSRAPT